MTPETTTADVEIGAGTMKDETTGIETAIDEIGAENGQGTQDHDRHAKETETPI